MKAFVDKHTCIGCGLCESICPKVFKMNDEGIAEAIDSQIEEALIESTEEARIQCPVEAITVEK